jgi:membrane fusion protein, multidrug efflux system
MTQNVPTAPRIQGIGIILVTALLLGGCSESEPLDLSVRPVVVEPVKALDQSGAALFPGTVVARDDSALGFRIPGELARRPVEVGDRVAKGALLAELDPEDARLTLRAAEAAVAAAEADASLAEAERDRHADLLARGFVSQSVYDLRDNQFKLARARADQARAEADVQRNQSRYTRLVAPQAGLVTEVLVEEGEVLASGQPVVRFAPDEGREVEIQVPEGRLGAFPPEREMPVLLWAYPDTVYTGVVREVSPQADAATRTHRVRVRLLDADDKVRLGMTANLLLGESSDEPVFAVRHSALGYQDQQPVLWRVNDGRAQPVPVTVVRYIDEAVVLKGDLQTGDPVVSAGVQRLHPGQAVVVRARPFAADPADSDPSVDAQADAP